MEQSHWHGWSRASKQSVVSDSTKQRCALHIGPLPGRKQIVLYVANEANGTLTPLAYFKTEALAQEALRMLDLLVN